MKLISTALMTSAILFAAAPAGAQTSDDNGFTGGLRLSLAFPMGDAFDDATTGVSMPMKDQLNAALPIWLDAGYRFNRRFYVGLYFQYAFGFINSSDALGGNVCNQSGVSCSSHILRFGADFLYSFTPEASFCPWVGLGFGYEKATISGSDSGGNVGLTLNGWEFINLQLGGNFAVSPQAAIGPFVALSIGQFGTADLESGGTTLSSDIARTKVHEWITLGVRSTFNL